MARFKETDTSANLIIDAPNLLQLSHTIAMIMHYQSLSAHRYSFTCIKKYLQFFRIRGAKMSSQAAGCWDKAGQ